MRVNDNSGGRHSSLKSRGKADQRANLPPTDPVEETLYSAGGGFLPTLKGVGLAP